MGGRSSSPSYQLQFSAKEIKHYGEEAEKYRFEGSNEDTIEQVDGDISDYGHYLPQRPVIKKKNTTKNIPVFYASAREKNAPSLNHCLEKGMNLIETISSTLLQFRENKYGVAADIRKESDRSIFRTFLQIVMNEKVREL
ncbi:hypothetical protein NQ315_013501 [Exocentrus adspersus]|uniref:Uncharacterized protein n=1 Tax=Exocentrus adspersus TaxID=1586481 RepID=A0AAV8V941_9CUCU|nr:hypothetical protein NQ315_013501 [Exocentrus adspersus]